MSRDGRRAIPDSADALEDRASAVDVTGLHRRQGAHDRRVTRSTVEPHPALRRAHQLVIPRRHSSQEECNTWTGRCWNRRVVSTGFSPLQHRRADERWKYCLPLRKMIGGLARLIPAIIVLAGVTAWEGYTRALDPGPERIH